MEDKTENLTGEENESVLPEAEAAATADIAASNAEAVPCVDAAENGVEATKIEAAANDFTPKLMEERSAIELIGDDSEEADGELAVSDIGTYGDHIIEELSVEANVKKVCRYARVPEKVAKYVMAVAYLVLGALCIAIPARIEHALPYIVGGGLGLISLVQLVFAIIQKEYRNVHSNRTASSVIMIGLAVMIILEHDWAHTFIPIVWGVLGLFEGAHAFNTAISRISRGLRSSYYIIRGIIEVTVAFLLLYKPESYGELHIIVFGVSLIIDGIVTVPVLNKLFSRE